MRFEITGIEQATGEERTLVTDVFDEQEARDRAAAYGIQITSLRPAGDIANAAADIATQAANDPTPSSPPPRANTGKQVGSVLFGLLFIGVSAMRMAQGCNQEPERRLSPGEMQYIQDKMNPKMPDWAEDAKRNMNSSMEEINRIKAAEAAKNPGAPSNGGKEEWVKDSGGQWRRVK